MSSAKQRLVRRNVDIAKGKYCNVGGKARNQYEITVTAVCKSIATGVAVVGAHFATIHREWIKLIKACGCVSWQRSIG
jgi:hypothetical protein